MNIAITGNIGSGKSEAIKFLSFLKFKCISSDKIISDFYKNEKTSKLCIIQINTIKQKIPISINSKKVYY